MTNDTVNGIPGRRLQLRARVRLAAVTGFLLVTWAAAPVHAQSSGPERWAFEAMASGNANATSVDDPFLIFDATGTVRVHDGFDLIFQPYAHRMPGGDWDAEMYQLQIRYVPPTRLALRVDAGILTSPVGQNTLELLPDRNPTISAPSFYFAPLPRFDVRYDGVQLISGGYPVGAIVSSSGTKWDARAGVTDQTPTRRRNALAADRPSAAPQIIAGGGYVPFAGLRLGTSVAHGEYRNASGATPAAPAVGAADATMVTFEGEYAIGYSRFTGEWIRDRFETTTTPAVARGFSVMFTRTLAPRWFVASRVNRVNAPAYVSPTLSVRKTSSSGEATLGYRLSPDVTVRGGYQASRSYNATDWSHAFVMQAVWAQRWN